MLPADVVARLSSSPALAAAAQHWGLPRKARSGHIEIIMYVCFNVIFPSHREASE